MLDVPIFTRKNHPAFNPERSFLEHQRYASWSIADWQNANRNLLSEPPRTLSNRARHALFALLGGKRQWTPPSQKLSGKSLRRVLVFRYDKIGDYVCASPILRWLKAAIPNLEIDMISSHANHPLATSDLNVRAAFPVHPDKSFDLRSWLPAVLAARQNAYDAIFAVGHTHATKAAVLASLISRTTKKVAIQHDKRAAIYGLVFDYQSPMIAYEEHWARTMLRAVTDAVEPAVTPTERDAQAYLSLKVSDFDAISDLVQREGLDFAPAQDNLFLKDGDAAALPRKFGNPYCVVNVAASRFKPYCAWSTERVIEACQMLLRRFPEWFVLVTGAPADYPIVRTVVESVRNARCKAMEFPLRAAAAAIAGAKFVLTPDTATVHLASAVGIPVVGLYATLRSVAEWYPYQSPFALLLSPTEEGSINEIPMSRVQAALEELLSETNIAL